MGIKGNKNKSKNPLTISQQDYLKYVNHRKELRIEENRDNPIIIEMIETFYEEVIEKYLQITRCET